MNILTRKALHVLQQSHLDEFLIRALNNPVTSNFMLKYCWHERGYESYKNLYEILNAKTGRAGVKLADARLLEVGSGNSIGLGYFFMRDGIASWTSSDFHKSLLSSPSAAQREVRLVRDVAKKFWKGILDHVQILDGMVSFGPRFMFRELDVTKRDSTLIGTYDVIVSSAVFEHVPRELVPEALANLASYLKPGGLMIHDIDLRDHVNVANPHHFLTYSKEAWEKLTAHTIFYTNRLRKSDFLTLFADANLVVVYEEDEQTPLPKITIASDFKNYSVGDLSVTRIFVVLRKV